mgnify:CR=1 FL=1
MSSRKSFKNSQAGRLLSSINKPEQTVVAPEKVEVPKVEAAAVVPEKVEVPKVEAAAVVPEKVEVPKVEAAAVVPEKVEVPKVEAAAVISEKVEAPKVEVAAVTQKAAVTEAKVKIMIELPMSASIQINRVIDQQLMEGNKLTRKQFCINAILKALESSNI